MLVVIVDPRRGDFEKMVFTSKKFLFEVYFHPVKVILLDRVPSTLPYIYQYFFKIERYSFYNAYLEKSKQYFQKNEYLQHHKVTQPSLN